MTILDLNKFHTILFSDIDGTFADHSMSYNHAHQTINKLINKGILLVLVSSKPAGSIKHLLDNCESQLPFIFENGGGIAFPSELSVRKMKRIPEGYMLSLGEPVDQVKKIFEKVCVSFPDLSFFFPDMPPHFEAALPELRVYFPHWTDEQIKTGVVPHKYFDLAFAFDKKRTMDETSQDVFIKQLELAGLTVHQGGLFYHATIHVDKGKAVRRLTQLVNKVLKRNVLTYGIGDAPNDLPMLKAVDHAYVVMNPLRKYSILANQNITFIPQIGPDGFEYLKNILCSL